MTSCTLGTQWLISQPLIPVPVQEILRLVGSALNNDWPASTDTPVVYDLIVWRHCHTNGCLDSRMQLFFVVLYCLLNLKDTSAGTERALITVLGSKNLHEPLP